MRTLGIDPGYERLGIAVVEKTGGNEKLLYSECFQTPATEVFSKRLLAVADALQRIITTYSPTHVALENVFFNTNQKTAMDVAAVRGVILFLGERHSLSIHEYTPPQIKVAVAGSGRASKADVTRMVERLVTIEKEIALDDEYDAIAVALTHNAIHRL